MKEVPFIRFKLKTRLRLLFPKLRLVGLSVALASQDGLLDYQSLGFSHKERRITADPDTRYRVGSAGMSVTAVLLALLHDEGKLCLDTPVIRYLPEFRTKDEQTAQTLTPRDFLSHQSGFRDSEFLYGGRPIGLQETLAFFAEAEPFCPAREDYGVCLLGYALMGFLAERVSGMDFTALAKTRLFDPLEMRCTYYGLPKGPDAAVGYITLPDGTREVSAAEPLGLSAANGLVSTAADMARWLAFCLRGGAPLLNPDTMRSLQDPLRPVTRRTHLHKGIVVRSACGWRVEDYQGQILLTCAGGAEGFAAGLTIIPSRGLGLALLSNSSGAGRLAPLSYMLTDRLAGLDKTDWQSLFHHYWHVLMAPQRELRAEIRRRLQTPEPMPEPLSAYAGVYRHPSGVEAELLFDMDRPERLSLRLGGAVHGFEHITGSEFILNCTFAEQFGVKFKAKLLTGAQDAPICLHLWLDSAVAVPMVFTKV